MSKTILKVVSSFRGDQSASNALADAIVAKLLSENEGAKVEVRDVSKGMAHLDAQLFTAFITPEADRTEDQKAAVAVSDAMIEELFKADYLVIGVPMYNFTIPSVLKSWLDHVARANVTFKYTESGAVGLVEDTKAYLAIATGGIYTDAANAPYDFTESYLKATLAFIGVTDVETFRAEGMAIPDLAEGAVDKAIKTVEAFSF
ncbi:FMN-dependent NADH-azoreductase [Neptunitalea lumnitzerae]|uniref:FMN dependent NADH:quinone oxidoreductase n=1 Tax=Neptunitalea lumnitzerae TaxID=2965509 RepID=A0ABQ5MHN5_9FLAO|nr:NAD(P)H-dependent oxidoreductase [Neptunitalea sp. Y10]GLB48919.1 FMN-dependent NADH-azoreductase [Neptunitalea sp. Y10]